MVIKIIKDIIEKTAMYKFFDEHYPNGAWLESKELTNKIIREIENKKEKNNE